MNTVSKIKLFAMALLLAALPVFSACANNSSPGDESKTSDVQSETAATETVTEEPVSETEETVETAPFVPLEIENVTYKKVGGTELGLDIYGPTVPTEGPGPVLFYIHGGSWISGSRSIREMGQLVPVVNEIRKLGVTVVPVSYRLTTETVTFPAHINDVCDAIRFVVKHADEYNIDSSRVGLIGFSAGGHLSLLAGLCTTEFGDDPELAGIDFDVKAVIDFCGPADLTNLADVPSEAERYYVLSILKSFLGAAFEENLELYSYASPISHVGKNPDLSLLILQGQNDELVPYVQVERLYQTCLEAGYDVTYIPVENATHTFIPADTTKPTSPSMADIIAACIEFIKTKLI